MASSPEERFIVEEATLEKIQGWITEIPHETGVNIWHQPKHCIKRNVSKMTIDLHRFALFHPPPKIGINLLTNSCNPCDRGTGIGFLLLFPLIIYQNVCQVMFGGGHLGTKRGLLRPPIRLLAQCERARKRLQDGQQLQETNHKGIRFAKSLPFLSLQRFTKSSPFDTLIWTLYFPTCIWLSRRDATGVPPCLNHQQLLLCCFSNLRSTG